MKKNKVILKYCPNFYKIKNFEYEEEDSITEKLINIYEDYIFNINENDEENVKRISILDKILGKYIDDYNFRKEIKNGVMAIRVKRGVDVIDSIVNSLISLFSSPYLINLLITSSSLKPSIISYLIIFELAIVHNLCLQKAKLLTPYSS